MDETPSSTYQEDEVVVVSSEERSPNKADFAPPEVEIQLGGPGCVRYEFGPTFITAWNDCGRSLNLKAIWKRCVNGPCRTVPPGSGYRTRARFPWCNFDGVQEC